ncbi:unnamed protein product [Zymoseptoria tritici ST99CH_3D1]|nr:unnamed protein product [Zymoseptoria tritici ST99CH_3D1]
MILEKFYNFYLYVIKRRPAKFDDPGDWLGRIDFDVELLPPKLRDRPLDFFAGHSRDLPTAQLCLGRYITTTLRGRSKEEQRAEYRKEENAPGRKALAWLLREYDSADLSANAGFLKALVHCMTKGESHAWRGAVLRFFVESQTYWAQGAEGINAALRTFEYSWTFAVPYGEDWLSDPLVVPKQRAGVWIFRQLLFKGANLRADTELFDQFILRLRHWRKFTDQCIMRADLLRVHPTKPTGLPSLEFIRRFHTAVPRPIFMRHFFDSWNGFGFMLNSAKLLETEGYKKEARWVLDIGLLEMPNHFNPQARYVQGKSDRLFGYEATNPGEKRPVRDDRQKARAAYLSDGATVRIF